MPLFKGILLFARAIYNLIRSYAVEREKSPFFGNSFMNCVSPTITLTVHVEVTAGKGGG